MGDSTLGFIGENIAKGALSYVGGDAAGWVLSRLVAWTAQSFGSSFLFAQNRLSRV